jgi:hypothetical protein
MTSNVARYAADIPAALWSDLHAHGLIPEPPLHR